MFESILGVELLIFFFFFFSARQPYEKNINSEIFSQEI